VGGQAGENPPYCERYDHPPSLGVKGVAGKRSGYETGKVMRTTNSGRSRKRSAQQGGGLGPFSGLLLTQGGKSKAVGGRH